MNLKEIVEGLNLQTLTPEVQAGASANVSAGYASDLLSDVLANAPAGGVLITTQVHVNAIAVSVHAGLAAVVFASGRTPEETARERAVEQGIALYASEATAFDITGQLYAMGLRGHRNADVTPSSLESTGASSREEI